MTIDTEEALARMCMVLQERRETRFALRLARPLAASLSDARLRDLLDRLLPMAGTRAVRLRRERNGDWLATVSLRYRMGVRLVDARAEGSPSAWSEEERQTLDAAKRLVAQAQAEVSGAEELARRLFDAVRASAMYEDPPTGSRDRGQVIDASAALLRGRANCQGFADAFYLVGTLAGLTVAYVPTMRGGKPHLRNALRTDDGWRTVDVTAGEAPWIVQPHERRKEGAR